MQRQEPDNAPIAWIAREILPHERDLRRWMRRALPGQDVDDAVQEIYCRLSALADVSHVRDGRAYLFTIGKRMVLERLRGARIVSIDSIAEIDAVNALADDVSPERIAAGRQELRRVQGLIAGLPERCRRVIELRKIEGLSQRDVAARLGVPEHTVENDVAKGLRLILRALAVADEPQQHDGEEHARPRNRRRDR